MLGGKQRSNRIRAPKRNAQSDVDEFNLIWTSLEASFRQIHTKQVSAISFEELYRGAYRLVLKKRGEDLYTKVLTFENDWLAKDVYRHIKELQSPGLTTSSASSASTVEKQYAGERLLKGVKQQWQDHDACMVMLSDVLLYLDRVYCTDKQIATVYSAGMRLFRDRILISHTGDPNSDGEHETILELVMRTMLDHVNMERQGETIDKPMLKSCTFMLEAMYIDHVETDDQRLYNAKFEQLFLETSRQFYMDESERMLRESDAGAYCVRAKRRLIEESDRCKSTLSESTRPHIEQVVLQELIAKRLPDLIAMDTGVNYMIDNDKPAQLGLVYELSGKVDPEKQELVKALQKRIVDMGMDVNKSALLPSSNGEASSLVQQTAAAIRWVDEVLNLKDRFDQIWVVAFERDSKMQTAITKSFTDFINSGGFNRGSEYISLFIDDNMKKGIKDKTDDEVDAVLEKAITLLRYVLDKDMFERYYKRHLSKRLLQGRSISIDVEKQMIGKMKIELGNAFTSKIEAMFKDMTVSEELTASFKQHMAESRANDESKSRPIDLGVHILTSMTWPQDHANSQVTDDNGERQNIIYPPEIDRIIKRFSTFYAGKHNGRMLTWQPAMGTADIKARFPGTSKDRMHDLNVSTYAMIILLLFNDLPEGSSLSFREIQAQTNIPTHDLIRNLQSLACVVKTRILNKSPSGKDINEGDRFSFNTNFTSKFLRVKVAVVASGNRVETDRERMQTEQKNDESRQYICEAAIVRIMKQRKELAHQQLLAETLHQLTHFKPSVQLIKARIEALIERDYLERMDDGARYKYLA